MRCKGMKREAGLAPLAAMRHKQGLRRITDGVEVVTDACNRIDTPLVSN